jgi:DNA-binding response OmpR family regulator
MGAGLFALGTLKSSAEDFPHAPRNRAVRKSVISVTEANAHRGVKPAYRSLQMSNTSSAVVLVVEDDAETRQMLSVILGTEGFSVLEAATAAEALKLAQSGPDLVILDWILPDISGIEVCRRLRENSTIPILMLTGRSDTADKVLGLNIGADDYMAKPFEPGELIARVRALLRRASGWRSAPKRRALCSGILRLEPESYEVYVREKMVPFTRLEFDLLYCLVENAGKVLTRTDILKQVWGEDEVIDLRGIDAHIRKLRQKIEDNPDQPRQIVSVYGVGYKFVPMEEGA